MNKYEIEGVTYEIRANLNSYDLYIDGGLYVSFNSDIDALLAIMSRFKVS